jgi:hypothetical protein
MHSRPGHEAGVIAQGKTSILPPPPALDRNRRLPVPRKIWGVGNSDSGKPRTLIDSFAVYLDELPSTRVTDMRRSGAVTPEMRHIAVTLQRDSGNSIYERRDECRTLLAVVGPWAAVRRTAKRADEPQPEICSFLTAFPSKLDPHPAFALLRRKPSPLCLWYNDTAQMGEA